MNDLVMAAATAKVACPTAAARLLAVHVTRSQPLAPCGLIDPIRQIAHAADRIANEAMTGRKLAISRNAKIALPRSARICSMTAAMNFLHRGNHVREWIRRARADAP